MTNRFGKTWVCPNCKKEFKHPNQAHSCARVDLTVHLENKSPDVKATFDKLIREVRKFGRVTINSVKTSIQVKAVSTFMSIRPKKNHLEIEFLLGKEVSDFLIYKSIRISKNRVVQFVVLDNPRQVNARLMGWLRKSYELVKE